MILSLLLRGYPGDVTSPVHAARDRPGYDAQSVAQDESRWAALGFFTDTQHRGFCMPSFDRLRFIYSLAGILIAGEWNAGAIRAVLRNPTTDQPMRVPMLAERVLAAFAVRPGFYPLVAFLLADPGLERAWFRSRCVFPRRLSRVSLRLMRMEDPPVWLGGIGVPQLATEGALARWFDIKAPRLRWYADVAGRNRRHPPGPLRPYRYRWVPRRQGPPRLLEIPKVPLKRMQQKILGEILDKLPVHPAAHGFCRGRSIITNASAHCGKPVVLRFDLVDFFPSVSSGRVFRLFRTLGYPARVARLLMGLCTATMPANVWEQRPGAREGADFLARQRLTYRHLPQGAPTSPALANLAAHRLDRRLSGLADAVGAVYTRYADDLTFSGGPDLGRSRKRLATLVAVIADEEGFTLNHRKTRIMRAGVRQHVTGVVVNVRPNIPRDDFDRLKAILTNCVRHGPAAQNREGHADFRAHLAGRLAHVASIHPTRGEKLRYMFRQIRWDS